MKHYPYIVLGLGTMGSAALYHLARKGCRVLGIDQFQPPHEFGSGHGETRIFRMLYQEGLVYMPLLSSARTLWQEIQSASGLDLFYQRPFITVSKPEFSAFKGAVTAAKNYNLPFTVYDAKSVKEYLPWLTLPEDGVVCLDPQAGIIVPELAVKAHLDLARKAGAETLLEERIEDIIFTADTVKVITTNHRFTCDRVICTLGAWSKKMCPPLGDLLKPIRTVMHYYQVSENISKSGVLPSMTIDTNENETFYGIFSKDGTVFKGGIHTAPDIQEVDPDTVCRTYIDGEDRHCLDTLQSYFNANLEERIQSSVCMYTMTPDDDFIIDRLENDKLLIGCGFSGHGFKFAPVIGQIMTELATAGSTEFDLSAFSARRFTSSPS